MPARPAKPLAFNDLAADRLREAATLLAHQDDNPFRIAAYRRAADAVAALDTAVRDLLEVGGIETLQASPGVGPRIAGGLAELARTARWMYLDRLRGSGEPLDIFCTIPCFMISARKSRSRKSAIPSGPSHQSRNIAVGLASG